jgi:preprotein translocase subunit SecG
MLAAVFFVTSLGLAYFASQKAEQVDQLGLPDPAVLEVPKKVVEEDVPVLEGQVAPSEADDVPEVPGQ